MKAPAKAPCVTCPYRRDVPSGVWAEQEYAKLPPYDEDTHAQPPGVFLCHQQDGRVCAGWAGCHDMGESLALRLAVLTGAMSGPDFEAVLGYQSPVPLFASGAEAAEHGRAEILDPGPEADRAITRLSRKQAARAATADDIDRPCPTCGAPPGTPCWTPPRKGDDWGMVPAGKTHSARALINKNP